MPRAGGVDDQEEGKVAKIKVTTGEHEGTHSGRSPDTIARRLFGRTAEVRRSPDPNSETDMIIRERGAGGFQVLAEIVIHEEGK